MTVRILPIEWRSSNCRPQMMASVHCPSLKDWNTGLQVKAWMGITHCNTCSHARELHINYKNHTGEVHCAAK